MNILKNWKDKIIFGFYNCPAETWNEKQDAGFSVRLFANGTVIYQTYYLDAKSQPTIKLSGRATLSEDTMSKITRILAGYAKEIDALPEYTNNGPCDGTFYNFVFCGKYVSTLNLKRTAPSEVMQNNPDYYEKYRFDLADENTILDIFTKIADAMNRDGVFLYLHHLETADETIY